MSDRSGPREEQKKRTRVWKSHQVVGGGVIFPVLEPPRVWPVSLPRAPVGVPLEVAEAIGQVSPALQPRREAPQAALKEAEERARALERQAAALLKEAEETAAMRLAEVKEQCEQMLNRAAQAIGQIEAEARQEGHESGKAEGYQGGLAEAGVIAREIMAEARAESERILAEAREATRVAMAGLAEQRQRWLKESEGELLDLAFVLARQVLKTELALRPEAMLPMVRAAVARLKGEEEPLLRVGADVLPVVEAQRGELLAAATAAKRLSVDADTAMEAGDFVVQGTQGLVNGRLDNQLKVLRTELDEGGSL